MSRLLIALLAIALGVAACSDDGAGTTSTTTEVTTPATTTTTLAPTTTAPTSTTTTSTTTTLPPWPLAGEATLDAEIAFEVEIADEEDPVLPIGDTWDTSYSYSPFVVLDDAGTFHMFFTGWGANDTGIGHATSPDGRYFTRSSDEPIIAMERDVAGRTAFAQAPVVHQDGDGSWVMYFAELISRRFHGRSLWRATAPAAEGPWTIDDEPFYTSTADWEREVVTQGLVRTDDGILILYDGVSGDIAVGALWSDDGATFAPFDDPATTDASDPVLMRASGQSWEGESVGSPIPFARQDGGYDLFYIGFEGPDNLTGDRPLRIGYARGDLEGPWERFADNPIIDLPTQNSAASSLGYPWLSGIVIEGDVHIYYALSAGSRGVGRMIVSIDEG